MKLLLVAINAKYIHSNLAIYSLRSYASKYDENIQLLEYTINHSQEDILKGIYKEKADIIAFSCYIWNIDIITRVVRELKKVQPSAIIWFGGPEVSYDAKQCLMRHNNLTGIMVGEGEQTFLELMEYYVKGKGTRKEIDGLVYKSGDVIINTSVRKPMSLDTIPFPYKDLSKFENKIIYYESSRGCPFSCSYCLSSIEKGIRLRSIDLVKKELKIFLDANVSQVKFVDRTFNCNKKHAMDIWRFIKEQDNNITNFHFEISADLLTEDEIQFLSTLRPGQIQFEIGVQSTNPETVAAIHRITDFQKLSYNVNRIREYRNIHQHLDLIAGLPLESYDAFEKSFEDVYKLGPDQLQLGFLKVLKGAYMEEDSKKYGIVYRDYPPYEVLFTNHLTYDEMLQIKGVSDMVEIYYNSGQFTNTIQYLEYIFETPMKLYQSIYSYYVKNELNLIAHSRIKRYEILHDYYNDELLLNLSTEEQMERKALFDEILMLDLLLRENIKSRPAFAVRVKNNELRHLYEEYGKEHKLYHIEQFIFDVIVSARTGKAIKKETILLFDYSNKDTLNKSAQITSIEATKK